MVEGIRKDKEVFDLGLFFWLRGMWDLSSPTRD